jgi:hypothetical protein
MFQPYFAGATPTHSRAHKRICLAMAPIAAAVCVLLSLSTDAIAEATTDR